MILMPIVSVWKEIIFESSDEEGNGEIVKIKNYVEDMVPRMSDKQFKQNFRLTATTFEDLFVKVKLYEEENNISYVGFPKTTTEKELLLTVWYLGNLESMRSVAERFDVSISTCWCIIYRTCKLVVSLIQKFNILRWPNEEEQANISAGFAAKGFPGVIGCIDGSHIKINAPQNYPNSYVNRKGYHSLLLQAVCDDKLMFRDVYAGEAGSIHDYTLFKRSDLYENIVQGNISFSNNSYLLGDLAYRLSTFLMTSYKDNHNITRRERKFNTALSKVRVSIENAFALLKGRFRRLKFIENRRLDLATLIICGACVLHNFCMSNGDLSNDILDLEAELIEERRNRPHNEIDLDVEGDNRTALVKRNIICALISNENV